MQHIFWRERQNFSIGSFKMWWRINRMKVFTLSVWPGAAASTFPLLQSHTQIVFFESNPTDTRHCKEGTEINENTVCFLTQITANFQCSLTNHIKKLIMTTEQLSSLWQFYGAHLSIFLPEDTPTADWVGSISGAEEEKAAHGNPSSVAYFTC